MRESALWTRKFSSRSFQNLSVCCTPQSPYWSPEASERRQCPITSSTTEKKQDGCDRVTLGDGCHLRWGGLSGGVSEEGPSSSQSNDKSESRAENARTEGQRGMCQMGLGGSGEGQQRGWGGWGGVDGAGPGLVGIWELTLFLIFNVYFILDRGRARKRAGEGQRERWG